MKHKLSNRHDQSSKNLYVLLFTNTSDVLRWSPHSFCPPQVCCSPRSSPSTSCTSPSPHLPANPLKVSTSLTSTLKHSNSRPVLGVSHSVVCGFLNVSYCSLCVDRAVIWGYSSPNMHFQPTLIKIHPVLFLFQWWSENGNNVTVCVFPTNQDWQSDTNIVRASERPYCVGCVLYSWYEHE